MITLFSNGTEIDIDIYHKAILDTIEESGGYLDITEKQFDTVTHTTPKVYNILNSLIPGILNYKAKHKLSEIDDTEYDRIAVRIIIEDIRISSKYAFMMCISLPYYDSRLLI